MLQNFSSPRETGCFRHFFSLFSSSNLPVHQAEFYCSVYEKLGMGYVARSVVGLLLQIRREASQSLEIVVRRLHAIRSSNDEISSTF